MAKRRSLGHSQWNNQPTKIPLWRSPGHCEIPDILGNAYLPPTLSPTRSKHKEPAPKR
ncbi:hypothetical protein CU098_000367, partial [Rhizopus stolonifer]